MKRFFVALITLFTLTLFACSGDEGDTVTNNYIEGAQCVPGQSVVCGCLYGTSYQVCNSFGTYDECRCRSIKPEAGTDADTPETSIEKDADIQPDSEVDAGSDTGTDSEASVEEDADSPLDAEVDVEIEAETDAGTDSEASVEEDADIQPDSEVDAGYDKLVVYGNNHPASEIVIGGQDVWRVFSDYKACANLENVRIKIVSTEILGTLQSEKSVVTDVGIAVGGALQGTGDFDGSGPGLVDVDLGNGFVVPAGDCVAFQVWAKLAEVLSTAACSLDECPRSGKAIKIRVGYDSSEWYWGDAGVNHEWDGKLYIHAFGETSGEQVYADKGASEPNFMVVRKSKPVVTPQNLVNNVLSVGQRELARWQVGANGIGGVDQKQFPLHTQWDNGVTLENFRLYRNSLAVAIDQYTITDLASGVDLTVNPAPDALGTYPIVAFKGSDAVYGNGNVYSLYATISTTGSGHHVSTSFINPGAGNITGNLVNNVGLMPPEVASPNIWHVQEPGGGYGVGLFLWSDISEVPHGTSSADWATGYLVEVLDHTWTLSN